MRQRGAGAALVGGAVGSVAWLAILVTVMLGVVTAGLRVGGFQNRRLGQVLLILAGVPAGLAIFAGGDMALGAGHPHVGDFLQVLGGLISAGFFCFLCYFLASGVVFAAKKPAKSDAEQALTIFFTGLAGLSARSIKSGPEVPYQGSKVPVIQGTIYDLLGKAKDLTDLQAESIFREAVGKWLPIEGKVRNVTRHSIGIGVTLESFVPSVHCFFTNDAAPLVSHLSSGNTLRVVGRVQSLSQHSCFFEDCEPI